MDDDRDMSCLGCHNDRHRDKTTFGKDNIGTDPSQQASCLKEAVKHTERIGQVFPGTITAELAGTDTIVRDLLILDQSFFNTFVGTDIMDLISIFL